MPNQSKGRNIYDGENASAQQQKQDETNKPKSSLQDKATSNGWFGGIWNKLSLRPKNQMKLPDDKNPTVRDFQVV